MQGASQIMPLTTRFFWGDIDLKWYPEACFSHRRSKGQGFYTVRHFMEGAAMPGSRRVVHPRLANPPQRSPTDDTDNSA